MAKRIEAVGFSLSFRRGEEEMEVNFTINVDRDVYDDQKEAAIDHVSCKWDAIRKELGAGWVPVWKTFRVLQVRSLSDLGLS